MKLSTQDKQDRETGRLRKTNELLKSNIFFTDCENVSQIFCWKVVVVHGSLVPNFWGRGPEFASGIYHNDPDALQDHCVKMVRSGNVWMKMHSEKT